MVKENELYIKRKPDNAVRFKVNNGERIKMYLDAQNTSPNKKPYSLSWGFGYKIETGKEELRSVLLEISNVYCGEEVPVTLECEYAILWPEKFLSIVEENSTSDFFPERESVTRIFSPWCDVQFNGARLCYPGGGEIPEDGGFYNIRRVELVSIVLDVEGLNTENVPVRLQYKEGIYYTTIDVRNNQICIPCKLRYEKFEEEFIDDVLSVSVKVSSKGGDMGHGFNLRVHGNKQWSPEDIREYLQVVVAGTHIQIAENNFHPCKYTDLEIRDKVKNKCIFIKASQEFADFFEQILAVDWRVLEESEYEESAIYKEADGNKTEPFALVCGEQQKKLIVLAKEYDTKICDTKRHSQKIVLRKTGQDFFSGQKYVGRRLVEKSSGLWECEIPVDYNYGIVAKTGMFAPLNYFFPFKNPQIAILEVASCRRTLKIPVHVYPDIQWAFAVHFSIGKYTKSERVKKHFELDKQKEDDGAKNTFEVSLSASWNITDEQPANKYSIYVNIGNLKESIRKGNGWDLLGEFLENQLYRKILVLYEAVMEVFSFLDLFDQVMKSGQSIVNDIRFSKWLPTAREKWEFDLTLPKIDLALNWRAGAHNGKGGFIIEGSSKGQLLGLEARFDMFALAGKMPQLRIAIMALSIIEYSSMGRLKLRFDLVISGDITFDGKLGYDNPRDKFTSSLCAKGNVKLALVLSGKVESRENHRLVTKEYGAKGEAGIKLTYEIVPADDGLYSPFTAAFTGLTVSIYCKITVKKAGKGLATDNPVIEEKPEITITKMTFINGFSFYESDKKESNSNKII